MGEPFTTQYGGAAWKLRLVIYTHILGVCCSWAVSRLDGMAPRPPWLELVGIGAGLVAVATLFACPLLALGMLVAYRGRLNDRDLFGTIALECLILTAQLIALLPTVQ